MFKGEKYCLLIFSHESVPVNQKLSDIFLQLHISERSGQGVPSIVDVYGREAYEFRENSIVVNIPYERLETAWTTSRKSTIDNEKTDYEDLICPAHFLSAGTMSICTWTLFFSLQVFT